MQRCILKDELKQAILDGDNETLVAVLDAGVDVDSQDQNKMTALHLACLLNRPNMVDVLIAKGASVSLVDRTGYPLLGLLCRRGLDQMALKLISAGADVKLIDPALNQTAFIAAGQWGREALVQPLIEAGSEVWREDCGGWSALTYAAYNGHIDFIKAVVAQVGMPERVIIEQMQSVATQEYSGAVLEWIESVSDIEQAVPVS